MRLRVRIIKIDSWDAAEEDLVKIFVNNAWRKASPIVGAYDSGYTGDQCGSAEFPERSTVVDYERNDATISEISIRFECSLKSPPDDESWGFSHFILSLLKCHPTCKTCLSQLETGCLTCYSRASKKTSTNTAACGCDDGYYAVITDPCFVPVCTVCQPCASGCKTCSGPAETQCSSCFTDYKLIDSVCYMDCFNPMWASRTTRICVAACASNEYGDSLNRVCRLCDSSCLTCSSGGSSSCLTCQPSLFFLSSQCLVTCPSGMFGNTVSKNCEPCQSPCETCSSSATYCESCLLGKTALSGSCVDICRSDQYRDTTANLCKNCHSECLTCSGALFNNCLTCGPNLYFDEDLKTCKSSCIEPKLGFQSGAVKKCVISCPSPYFAYAASRTCELCHNDCLTCNGLKNTDCLTCKPNHYLQRGSCVEKCSAGFFTIASNFTCGPCDSLCLTCVGPKPQNCLTCSSVYVFVPNPCTGLCPSPNDGNCLRNKNNFNFSFLTWRNKSYIFSQGLWFLIQFEILKM